MLTDKQNKFVTEYLVDFNATQAAIRTGYSAKTAYSQGQRLLKNVEISAEINRRQAISSKKLEIKREDALNRQNSISRAYEVLLELSLKDKMTKEEQEKFARLMMVVRASDATRADEFLSKHLNWAESSDSIEDDDTEIKITIVKKDGNKGNNSI